VKLKRIIVFTKGKEKKQRRIKLKNTIPSIWIER